MGYPGSVARLIEAFKTLPGVGSRTAERLAFHLLKAPDHQVTELAEALLQMQSSVVACSVCNTISESDPCPICADDGRERARVLVVEQPRDVAAFEDAGWRGLYHVLLGHINPLEGMEAGHLTIEGLVMRVRGGGIEELIVATNPDYEGDATSLHLKQALEGESVSISRIARGVASGSAIEYSNAAMLADALAGRVSMDA